MSTTPERPSNLACGCMFFGFIAVILLLAKFLFYAAFIRWVAR